MILKYNFFFEIEHFIDDIILANYFRILQVWTM